MEVGEAVGGNEEVVVGQVGKVGACDGRQHDTRAAEELAHGRAGEMGLVGEVVVGEFSDSDVEAAVGVGEV